MLDENTKDYIEDRASRCAIEGIVESLINILGAKMTAYLSGANCTDILNLWLLGVEKPTKLEELRLRYAYRAAAVINVEYGSEMAVTIFRGMNGMLDDRAPAFWLRHHGKEEDFKLVVSAALNVMDL